MLISGSAFKSSIVTPGGRKYSLLIVRPFGFSNSPGISFTSPFSSFSSSCPLSSLK